MQITRFLRRTLRGLRGTQTVVVAATANSDALRVLWTQPGVAVREARTTDGVNALLGQAQLVVVDPNDMSAVTMDLACVEQVLRDHGLPCVGSATFLSDPQRWIAEGRSFGGDLHSLPARLVAFTSLDAGGVGKSTLALNLALGFARRTSLPVAIVELSHARSGLLARLPGQGFVRPPVDAYTLATQGADPGSWRDRRQAVTVVPMDGETMSLLSPEAFRDLLVRLRSQHVLTVVEGGQPHRLWYPVQELADQIFVVAASSRLDTMANARALAEELRGSGRGASKVSIVLNQASSMDSVAARFVQDMPYLTVSRSNAMSRYADGKTAQKLLASIWPGARL
jgi:Flp pilus assembly CpaE family ATPase